MPENDAGKASYDAIKKHPKKINGTFTTGDILAEVPGVNRYYVRKALIRLTEEGYTVRYGTGRSTYYMKR